jgi:hypothetical protein
MPAFSSASRVHRRSLTWGDAEEGRIKKVDSCEETAHARNHLAWLRGIGIVELIDLPAVGRYFRDAFTAMLQQVPKGRGIVRSAGEAAAHADDSDRLVPSRLRRAELLLHLLHGPQSLP